MGLEGLYPWMLREVANVIARPHSIPFEKSWALGKVPEHWKKENVTAMFKKGKKEHLEHYRLISLTSVPGKMMEQIMLEVISTYIKDKKVIGSSQHGFTKGKSCLINLIACYDEINVLAEERRAVDVISLDFSKAFDTVFRNVLIIDKLIQYALGKLSNSLNCCA